jgi:hypothetical protein
MSWLVHRRFSWLDMAFMVSGIAMYKSLGLAAFLGYMLVAAVLSVIAEKVWRK